MGKIVLPGGIVTPDGTPARYHAIAEHNRRNRARLRAQLGRWREAFRPSDELKLCKTRFVIREMWEDLMVLGAPDCTDEDEGWYQAFRNGQLFPLRGWEFVVQDIYYNSLHLLCRGPTGRSRKGHW